LISLLNNFQNKCKAKKELREISIYFQSFYKWWKTYDKIWSKLWWIFSEVTTL